MTFCTASQSKAKIYFTCRIADALVKADKLLLFKGSQGSVNASFFTLTLSLGALFRRMNSGMQWHIVIPLYISIRNCLRGSINKPTSFFRLRRVLGVRMRVARQTTKPKPQTGCAGFLSQRHSWRFYTLIAAMGQSRQVCPVRRLWFSPIAAVKFATIGV